MSRILLVRPPAVFPSTGYSAPVTMPLAVAYLASTLVKSGHGVQCIDALGEAIRHIDVAYADTVRYRGLSTPQILSRITERPHGIGISTMFSQDWPHSESIINAINERFPGVPIIVGGEHATAAAEYILRTCPAVTFVAAGEGEGTIVHFAEFVEGKRTASDIRGIWRRDEGGAPVRNAPRSRIRDLDELPWPAWTLFDLEPYFEAGEGHGVERGRSMPILATRGCPYQCTFCSNPSMWTTQYSMRDVANVVDEIEHYITRYRARNIDFFDLTAIVRREWIYEFCNEINRRGLKFTWQLPSGTRSEALDNEVLAAMAANGCTNITYAPESGSLRTLRMIKKRVRLPRMFDSIRHAKRNGIFVRCNLIIGLPQERRVDVWKTVWCAMRFAMIGVDDVGLYPFSPYPGSELYAYLRKMGRIREMDRQYFESLMAFMNLWQSSNYCEKVGARELAVYRLLGMSLAYGLSYFLYPFRILRSIRNYRNQRSDTILEERFFAYLRRRRMERQMWQRREISPATHSMSPTPPDWERGLRCRDAGERQCRLQEISRPVLEPVERVARVEQRV